MLTPLDVTLTDYERQPGNGIKRMLRLAGLRGRPDRLNPVAEQEDSYVFPPVLGRLGHVVGVGVGRRVDGHASEG